MDLRYTPEDEKFRAEVRAWFEANVPRKPLQTLEERRAWHRKLYEAGFVGMGWPKEYGGRDARPMEQAIVAEEMARVGAPGTINGLGISICGPTLIAHGTEWQKQRYLKNILTADEIWCQLYSEPNAGSDLASLKTSAVKENGHFVVNGQKVWTSGGMIADLGILLARTDPTVPKHQGISYFVMDMHAPGVDVRPIKQITGSQEFCEVFMTNVKIPAENLIGELGQGWRLAQTTLGFERGGNTLSRATRARGNLNRLIEVAQRVDRNGRPA
ncbi:MAG TPA: acyl-CoA dehydrogenase family protein, partial [Chloroflexota bacterium]|nr:acyl-CoA dehydrogenase family protein [Chloroflexota bacterium]